MHDRVKTWERKDLGIVVSQGDCLCAHSSTEYAWEPRSYIIKHVSHSEHSKGHV